MARIAGRARQVVIVVDVAIRTLPRRHRVRVGQDEPCAVVIKRGIEPGARAVALIASRREIRRHVIRIRRSLVVLLVARIARRARQVVVVVDVAIRALPRRHDMHSGQCETSRRVIELSVAPLHRVVTLLTRCRKSRMRDRSCSVVVVVLMAAHARRAGDAVVVVDVAIRTLPWRYRMRPRQRKS